MNGLAGQRAEARAEDDPATAEVRQEVRGGSRPVGDTEGGHTLESEPPFHVWPTIESIPVDSGARDDHGAEHSAGDRAEAAGEAVVERHPGGREHAAGGAAKTPNVDDGTRNEVGTESMVASQVLWDSTLAASRLQEAISAAPATGEHAEAPSPVVTVALLVDGHPADLRTCVDALIHHTDAKILALDLGDVDGAGVVLHELAERHPERITAWHVAETPYWRGGTAGWGAGRDKLLRLDTEGVHVVMDTATIVDGDAITPLARAVTGEVVAAGWKGVDPGESGHDWHEAGPGEVRGLLGYLMAVRRDAALEAGGFPAEARYDRHADLEFSLRLPGKLVVPEGRLPVRRERRRSAPDVDTEYGEADSRRTDDRIAGLLRSGDR
ncbi:glycosyltransferase family 2 protein [Sphaerisporangium album]|uniref:Glycosyltransferase family 2 protein n=1 Tax=Sphaerisporangium album TaxID=509200 RepID=A0A367FMU5_9ACTN|nr:glycosyltransferase family 2 protein [Sphaerisporangium album]